MKCARPHGYFNLNARASTLWRVNPQSSSHLFHSFAHTGDTECFRRIGGLGLESDAVIADPYPNPISGVVQRHAKVPGARMFRNIMERFLNRTIDGDLDFAVGGKSGLFLFENLTKHVKR